MLQSSNCAKPLGPLLRLCPRFVLTVWGGVGKRWVTIGCFLSLYRPKNASGAAPGSRRQGSLLFRPIVASLVEICRDLVQRLFENTTQAPSPAGPHRHAHVAPCCYPRLSSRCLTRRRISRRISHSAHWLPTTPGSAAPTRLPTTPLSTLPTPRTSTRRVDAPYAPAP